MLRKLQSVLLRLLARLPLRLLHGFASVAATLAFDVVRWRRAKISANLQRAFPDLSNKARDEIAKEHVTGQIDVALETLKGSTLSDAELAERIDIANLDVLEAYAHRPVLLVGGHQGNWEWQMLALSARNVMPLEAVYAPLPVAAVDEFLAATRSRFGITLIKQEETLKEIGKRLKQPRAVIMLADQNPRQDAERCWLRFFHQDTDFGLGLEKLARLTRYPVIFFQGRRTSRGHYQLSFELIAEPPYDKEGHAVTEAYVAALVRSIEAQPADWIWSYPRWSHPKPLYE